MSLILTPDQPWLGLASYEETHRSYFFGRRAEEDDLFERVRRQRLTVLYGPSGLGKTSLLRAALMPRLDAAGWLPVRIRLSFPERLETIVEADPHALLLQVFESLATTLETAGHPAAARLHAVLTERQAPGAAPAALPSLWELWHDTTWGLRDPAAPRPVLLFDQFEEIFTLGEDEARARSAARVLRDALADLIEDRPPPALDRRLSEDPALAEQFDFAPDSARVVLVLREDYLSRLERWKKLLPSLLRNRMELRLLDGPRALQAIVGPARIGLSAGDPGLVPDEVAAAIVRAVSNVAEDTPIEDIEAVPPLLSLLCKELNEKRRGSVPPTALIDLALVRENRSAILQRFYEDCFESFPPAVRLVMEDHLLSPGGYRENPGYDTLVAALTARAVPDPAKVLSTLVERRLITAEDRGGRRRVELTHDVLAPILKRSLDERREREAAEEAHRQLAAQAALSRRRRIQFAILSVLTLLAVAGAIFGWHQARVAGDAARKATNSEAWAKSEAANAESSLRQARSELDRATLEEGKAWLERARTAAEKGDHFTAIMLAGCSFGFRGYGIEPSGGAEEMRLPALLGLRLAHNPEAETQRLSEHAAATGFIASLDPSFLPCWVRMHQNKVQNVAFSPDGTRLASGSWDNTVKLWDAATGKELATLSGYSVAFSPDGTRLASGSWDGTVKLWDAATGKELATLTGHQDWVRSVAFSPDGTRLASGSDDNTVKLWDAATGKELATLSGHQNSVWSVAFSPDGTRLATGSGDNTVKLWDVATGKELATLTGHQSYVYSVAFSPDGTWLASGSNDNNVKLWDAATGKELATLSGHQYSVNSVAFSPDGTRLASGADDDTVKLWDAATGKELATLSGHQKSVWSVAFSPDGTRLASGSWDNTVKLWDATTGKDLDTLTGHQKSVLSVAFSPDGTWLASGSDDNNVKLWDAATGKELATLSGHKIFVWRVAFSPDGTRLASWSDDNTVKLWDATTGKELEGEPDFPLDERPLDERLRNKGQLRAVTDGSVIRISPTSPRRPDLLHFIRHGLLELDGRKVVWKNDLPPATVNAVPAIHYRDDPLAGLAQPGISPVREAALRLTLMARASQWRPATAYWAGLREKSPALCEDPDLRQDYLSVLLTSALSPRATQSPDSLGKLVPEITAALTPQAVAAPRISLPLAQVILSLAAKEPSLAPQPQFEALLQKTAATTAPAWKQAVSEMAQQRLDAQENPAAAKPRLATIIRLLAPAAPR